MKKKILTAIACCLLTATVVKAESTIEKSKLITVTKPVKKLNVSSFCKAILEGDYDTVKRMIELGEDVNQKSLGMTPAIFAARYNKAEILELLIENGANLKIKSDKGFTVKKYAELSNADDALAVIEAAMGI
ncbi:ankyrin repeat domain-containing protein [Kriegella aquimaris]|uniref:Ankyrin repeat-containing protein n=1 Tax=Kriegella aquimaris TaxID=192904 RepID=A0A1G9PI37_9FLAO|nr:ankyrin repeat domain-containing protein [Kriegella aquimaris]SDL98203.1 Ankyrin repeat-containing protein [Kriegella aquimaris]